MTITAQDLLSHIDRRIDEIKESHSEEAERISRLGMRVLIRPTEDKMAEAEALMNEFKAKVDAETAPWEEKRKAIYARLDQALDTI